MKIRLYNAKILTMSDTVITDGELHTDKDKISYVGSSENAPEVSFDREINVGGNLIMPSFKNAHTHSAMTFLRSFADDMPLNDWLFKQVFPMEAKLTGDDIYTLTKLAYAEYLTSGTTACFDMYFEPDYVAQAAKDSSFRTVMCGSVSGSSSKEDYDSALTRLERFYKKFNSFDPLVSYRMGFHAEYTTDISILKGISELAKAYKQPVFTHNSETKAEVDGCIERHGMTPTALFDSLGMFEYGGGGFHCVHMTESDLDIFRQRRLWAVTNPCSNAKLASGIAPLSKMLGMDINLAIGTDGPASNNSLDMFREMYLATVMQKLADNDAASMPADAVLKMATVGGACAMGLDDCDVLSEGKQADLTVINLHRPNMQPLNNTVKNIVYSGSKENVKLTMCAGKVLYENGKFTLLDVEKLYSQANDIIKRMTD